MSIILYIVQLFSHAQPMLILPTSHLLPILMGIILIGLPVPGIDIFSKPKPLLHKLLNYILISSTLYIDGFKDEKGEYFLSQIQVADAVGLHDIYILRFLDSKQVKDLLGAASEFYTLSVEGSNKPIKVIPPQVASLFWADQAIKENSK